MRSASWAVGREETRLDGLRAVRESADVARGRYPFGSLHPPRFGAGVSIKITIPRRFSTGADMGRDQGFSRRRALSAVDDSGDLRP